MHALPSARPARWVLLMPNIPASPTSARVRVWRRLQAIGAVALKNSVYVLPNRDECVEAFQWLAREVSDLGGQASLCEGQFLDGLTDAEIERRFREVRNTEYAELSVEARALAKSLKAKRLSAGALPAVELRLEKVTARLGHVVSKDYFEASGRESAEGLVASVARALETQRGGSTAREALEKIARPQHATWVTRAGVHVDRIASAWLIRRFIDPQATLKFVPANGYLPEPGELRFDMFEAEFTHVADACTFEVLLQRMSLDDHALGAIGELVHDIDLRDERFARPETAGLASAITGVCASTKDDEARIAAAAPVLEALYAFFRLRARSPRGGSRS